MRIATLLLSLLISFAGTAQMLTTRHKNKLESITNSAKRAKLLQRYIKKDSIRFHKKKQQLQQQLKSVLRDSITVLPGFEKADQLSFLAEVDSTTLHSKLDPLKDEVTDKLIEEVPLPITSLPKDSASIQNLKQEGKQRAARYAMDELNVENIDVPIDSLDTQVLAQGLEQKAEKHLKGQLKGMEGSPSGLLSEQTAALDELREQTDMHQARQRMKAKMTSHARAFISRHADKIQQVQGKMGELKSKFNYVPNSNDLSTARKRTSLEDEPFKRRLTLGGNFNISKTNPVMLDASPVVGYRINTLFEVGFSGIYRTQLEADSRGVSASDERTYGYSFYSRHMAFKNFFGYVEGENISRVVTEQDQPQREWTQNLLVGIGREFKVTRWLEFQTIITYNLLHENRDGVYGSPVVFKTGIRIVK